MVVDAAVQYSIGHGAEISPISLQIDSDFRIVGFDASKVRVWKGRASSSADA